MEDDKNNNNFDEVPMEWSEFPVRSVAPTDPPKDEFLPEEGTEERYNHVLMQERMLSRELEMLNAKLCKLTYRSGRLNSDVDLMHTRVNFKYAELRSLLMRYEFLTKKAISNISNASNSEDFTQNAKYRRMKSAIDVSTIQECSQLKASTDGHSLKVEYQETLNIRYLIEAELQKLNVPKK